MLKHHNQIPATILAVVDLILANLAWACAYWSRFYWFNYPETWIPPEMPYIQAGGAVSLLTLISFGFNGVYRPQHLTRLVSEIFRLIKGMIGLQVFILSIAFFYREFSFSRLHLIHFIAYFTLFLIISRFIARWVLTILHQQGVHILNILLIGSSDAGLNFAQKIRQYRSVGLELKGYVRLNPSDQLKFESNISLLGTVEELPQIIKQYEIDQVFIALTADEHSHMPLIRELLYDQLVDIKLIPDIGVFKTLRSDVDTFEEIPIVTLIESPMVGWNRIVKQSVDYLGSIVAILLFSPVMLIIAVMTKITSPGPVFYKQERMGLDGVTFQTLKFRTMRIDAEKETGAVWASKDDDRCTPFGSFLRRSSLDELPQLFNVLKGEMSLVGPRPERPVFIDEFKKRIPNYMLRHKVKAGITGWAQINGWRGNTSLEKRIEYDLFYIEHWSVWFDIRILCITAVKGFIHPNAY
ncbi:MAG: undecaprenyl-phosphate glucose phosphotransferase [SAR324 cluster bacterium]|nr:undecaprenyl-phosphate glucose phosphotransferase [SAR324 cluster bacterium]